MRRTFLIFGLAFMAAVAVGCGTLDYNEVSDSDLAMSGMPMISGRLGTFSTEFKPGEEGRDTNVKLASESINQVVVKPGQEFSFNKTIGSTTAENGYKPAIIYVSGKKTEGYGGGVCQVSTTLYNAAESAGMTITERHDHSLPVTYVEAGREAATSHSARKDFKFKNELSHPVKIESQVVNGKITVNIYSV